MTKGKRIKATDAAPKAIERDPVTMGEFTSVMKQVMAAKPKTRSENREPTKEELNRKYRLVRR